MIYAKASEISSGRESALTRSAPKEIVCEFWQQWQEHRDLLYRCCLKLMNFNSTDAEDVLSMAMLKAWEKAQRFAGKIANFKAWLVRLTRNLCIDIIRERSRGASGVESIDWVGETEEIGTASTVESPESILEKDEKLTEIRRAIAQLPQRYRETFILHFYQECSHQEIAQQQGISYDNVCKRISQARKLLKQKLSGYFLEQEEEVCAKASARSGDATLPPTPQSTLPTSGATSLGAPVEKLKKQQPDDPKEKETANGSPALEPNELESKNICERTLVSGSSPQESRWSVKLPKSTIQDKFTEMGGAISLRFADANAVDWRSRIARLPQGMRQTKIPGGDRQVSCLEIAQLQDRFYQNVCKRNLLARAILPEELRRASIGADGANTVLSVMPTLATTESAFGEMSQGNGRGNFSATTSFSKLIKRFQFSIPSDKSVRVLTWLVSCLCERWIAREGMEESLRSPPIAFCIEKSWHVLAGET